MLVMAEGRVSWGAQLQNLMERARSLRVRSGQALHFAWQTLRSGSLHKKLGRDLVQQVPLLLISCEGVSL
jgi:L-amino acid N-acyltransferase YncA